MTIQDALITNLGILLRQIIASGVYDITLFLNPVIRLLSKCIIIEEYSC